MATSLVVVDEGLSSGDRAESENPSLDPEPSLSAVYAAMIGPGEAHTANTAIVWSNFTQPALAPDRTP
jgi:hypothetical protein